MLTAQDKKYIEDILERKLDEKLEKKLEEKLKFLPTKEDFYTKMDEIMGELKAIREEQTLISGKVSEHTDQLEEHDQRLGKIEKHLNLQSA
jgi:predicted nuclease with TOPRIM domain